MAQRQDDPLSDIADMVDAESAEIIRRFYDAWLVCHQHGLKIGNAVRYWENRVDGGWVPGPRPEAQATGG